MVGPLYELKPHRDRTDSLPMADFSADVWMVLAIAIAMVVLAVLGILSSMIRHHDEALHLRAEVSRLRREYAERLSQLGSMGKIDPSDLVAGDFDIVDDTKAAA